MRRFLMVVNVDWFFLSHRLPLALMMKEKGYEVYILTHDTGRKQEIEKYGLRFVEIAFARSGKNPLNEIGTLRSLCNAFKKLQPEIIHNVTIKPAIYGTLAARLAGLKKTQVVNAISGLGYNFINSRDGLLQRTVKRLMRYAYKTPNVKFIFQNPDDKDLYQAMGLLNNNFAIIKGAGVDVKAYPFTPAVPKEKLQVVVTSRMLYDKGIGEFIDAAVLLKNEYYGKALFILAGDIDKENPAGIDEAVLKKAMIPGYIEWVGHQSDVRPVLIRSDIVCLPSYREGLPKSLIEAMAIGRPVVTTDTPGCRECVEDGYNGYLVPVKNPAALADAIRKLLEDTGLRQKMGFASRKKMEEELSLDIVLKKTFEFYEQ